MYVCIGARLHVHRCVPVCTNVCMHACTYVCVCKRPIPIRSIHATKKPDPPCEQIEANLWSYRTKAEGLEPRHAFSPEPKTYVPPRGLQEATKHNIYAYLHVHIRVHTCMPIHICIRTNGALRTPQRPKNAQQQKPRASPLVRRFFVLLGGNVWGPCC